MAQLENIESIEKRLWKGADTLRANSNLASIVWLYRGETGKFLKLLESHINKSMTEAIESNSQKF